MGVLFSAAYMVSKGTDLLQRAKSFKNAILKMLQDVVVIFVIGNNMLSVTNLDTVLINVFYISESWNFSNHGTINLSRQSVSYLP